MLYLFLIMISARIAILYYYYRTIVHIYNLYIDNRQQLCYVMCYIT